jgi:hypothetical protein
MAVPLFLGLCALLWLPYGVLCFFRPGYLAEVAGVTAASVTATVELRAMYGGLQAALGLLAALAVVRPTLRRPALVALAFLSAGLGSSRLLAAGAAGEVSGYTGFALVLELGSASIAAWCLTREAR